MNCLYSTDISNHRVVGVALAFSFGCYVAHVIFIGSSVNCIFINTHTSSCLGASWNSRPSNIEISISCWLAIVELSIRQELSRGMKVLTRTLEQSLDFLYRLAKGNITRGLWAICWTMWSIIPSEYRARRTNYWWWCLRWWTVMTRGQTWCLLKLNTYLPPEGISDTYI